MDNQTLSRIPRSGYGFIYCYTSPSGKKYIGQTRTNLRTRSGLKGHCYRGCPLFNNAIQKYGFENFSVEILEEVPVKDLNEVETQYILDLNTTNPEYGYNVLTAPLTEVQRFNSIPIYSYDEKTGEFVKGYESICAAARDMKLLPINIRRVINDPLHHARGKLWKTEKFDKVEVIENGIQPHAKSISQYDPHTGEYIRSFKSIREAARETGYDRKTISDQVAGKSVQHNKYLFSPLRVNNIYTESSTTI